MIKYYTYKLIWTRLQHIYHENCIIPWLELHGTCPVCRKLVEEEPQTPITNRLGERRQANEHIFWNNRITIIPTVFVCRQCVSHNIQFLSRQRCIIVKSGRRRSKFVIVFISTPIATNAIWSSTDTTRIIVNIVDIGTK